MNIGSNEQVKEALKKVEDNAAAAVLMDIALKSFNNKNFTFYMFALQLHIMTRQLCKDKLLTPERAMRITKEISKLFDENINSMIDKEVNRKLDEADEEFQDFVESSQAMEEGYDDAEGTEDAEGIEAKEEFKESEDDIATHSNS